MKKRNILFYGILAVSICLTSCANDNSCTESTWYADADGDGFGDAATTQMACNAPNGFVADNTDCDDTNANINPGAVEDPNDGIDSDCGGEIETIIFSGPMMSFSKAASADWTMAANQDQISPMVSFTRQDNRQIYNYQWWQDNNNGVDPTADMLEDEFWDDSDPMNTGGTRGVRWAILDDTGANNPWDNTFNLYGTLGDPTNFFSLHNIATMINQLNNGNKPISCPNDFQVENEGGGTNSGTVMPDLVGKRLGVWLVDEDIYFELMFTTWGSGGAGGALAYDRSTYQF